jgi:hypothetical protein
MQEAVKTFPINTQSLSQKERRVFDLLACAAAEIASLYEQQKNTLYDGANFYPLDSTREEIEEAAGKNPEILNPYTFVEKDSAGNLQTTFYHERFNKELRGISDLLEKAALLTSDKAFADYLESRAKDLLQDNYDKSNILWLQTEKSKIGFVIGAFDRYHDKLFFKKRAYTAWLGLLDEAQTKEINDFREFVLRNGKGYSPYVEGLHISPVRLRSEFSAVLAGLDADFLFASNNLPSSADLRLIKKYGTMCTTFKPMVDWRFENWIFPIFEAFFGGVKERQFSKEELKKAFQRVSPFDEVCHSLTRYEDTSKRLEEVLAYFDEVYGDICIVRIAGCLFMQGLLTRREFEAIIVVEVCLGIYYLRFAKGHSQFDSLVVGYVHFLDYLLEGSGLKKGYNGFVIDFEKTFVLIDELSQRIEYYLALATKEEVQERTRELNPQKLLKQFTPYFNKLAIS